MSHIVMALQPLTSHLCLVTFLGSRPSHALGGTLDSMMTQCSWLSRGCCCRTHNSDHSSLLAVISIALAVTNVCVVGKFFLNIKSIGIQFVVLYRICRGVTFCLLIILLRFRTNICWCCLDIMYQLMSSCAQQWWALIWWSMHACIWPQVRSSSSVE